MSWTPRPASSILTNAGVEQRVTVPTGTDLGHVRTLNDDLDNIGVPSSYNLAVNGVSQEESKVLSEGDKISFRPVSGSKG